MCLCTVNLIIPVKVILPDYLLGTLVFLMHLYLFGLDSQSPFKYEEWIYDLGEQCIVYWNYFDICLTNVIVVASTLEYLMLFMNHFQT